mmetsp:Transcript_93752/g.262257  ORF Transcript_93752/g.262257 Transcript_93752/m.262257 type:complete len:234 (+) Transcript_93752:485-1186(+)
MKPLSATTGISSAAAAFAATARGREESQVPTEGMSAKAGGAPLPARAAATGVRAIGGLVISHEPTDGSSAKAVGAGAGPGNTSFSCGRASSSTRPAFSLMVPNFAGFPVDRALARSPALLLAFFRAGTPTPWLPSSLFTKKLMGSSGFSFSKACMASDSCSSTLCFRKYSFAAFARVPPTAVASSLAAASSGCCVPSTAILSLRSPAAPQSMLTCRSPGFIGSKSTPHPPMRR